MHLLDPAPFGRILPAMVTPMKADGAVDFEAAQQLARQLVADGADGLVVNGTTGESPTTHMEEKVELVQAVKEVVDVPVISGAGSNDTAHTVRMVEQTQEAGADAVLVVVLVHNRQMAANQRVHVGGIAQGKVVFVRIEISCAAFLVPCIRYGVVVQGNGVEVTPGTLHQLVRPVPVASSGGCWTATRSLGRSAWRMLMARGR